MINVGLLSSYNCSFSALTLLVGRQEGIQPVKTEHKNPLATVVDLSGWGYRPIACERNRRGNLLIQVRPENGR